MTTERERDELQKAYNALCSAERHLDGLIGGQTIRGRLAKIRAELSREAFSANDVDTVPAAGCYKITAAFSVPDHVVGLPSPWWRHWWQRLTRR